MCRRQHVCAPCCKPKYIRSKHGTRNHGISCFSFAATRRFHVPDDDFESARKAYEWPKRFAEVLREAGTKAASEHRQFEAALKVRSKEFEQQVEQYVAKLAVVEGRSDIIKREVAAAEVRCRGSLSRCLLQQNQVNRTGCRSKS